MFLQLGCFIIRDETDIVLEGFMEAERVHGVRYTQFIGDGDSSVYPTLLTSVPGWGQAIKKLSVQIMHANAIEAHLRSLSRITSRIKAVEGSLKNEAEIGKWSSLCNPNEDL